MPERKKDSHKGDYGHVLVLAGSMGLTGAAALCSLGALRCGCGLVTLGIPRSLNAIMETKLTEVMTRPLPETRNVSLSLEALPKIKKMVKGVDAVALGPGLSIDKGTKRLVNKLVKVIDKPLVIDADALNCIASNIAALKSVKSPIIITPHPGEMSRLSGLEIDFDRYDCLFSSPGSAGIQGRKTGRLYSRKGRGPGSQRKRRDWPDCRRYFGKSSRGV